MPLLLSFPLQPKYCDVLAPAEGVVHVAALHAPAMRHAMLLFCAVLQVAPHHLALSVCLACAQHLPCNTVQAAGTAYLQIDSLYLCYSTG